MSIKTSKELEFTTSRDYLGNPTAQTTQYLIHGAPTEAEAFAAVKLEAPTYIGDLKLKGYELDEAKGGGAWTYEVKYERSASGAPDSGTIQQPQYGYNTGSATAKMITPLEHVAKSDGSEYLPGIEFDGDKYNGVDIAKANPTESQTLIIRKSKVNTKYKRMLAEMSFTVNKEKFKGWEPGEVLFLGANISRSGDEDYSITFNFAISLNVVNVKILDKTFDTKDGWDFGWAQKNKSDLENKEILPTAKGAYIDRVYPRTDFKLLGLGS